MSSTSKTREIEFVKWLGPLLDALRELGGSGKPQEVTARVAKNLKISDSVLEKTLKSGILKFYNQVAWARQYLLWEGLLEESLRGIWTLSPRGYNTKLSYDQAYEICRKWSSLKAKTKKKVHLNGGTEGKQAEDVIVKETEEHIPEDTSENLPKLIEVLQSISPKGFENISKRLLREYGFENVEVTGGSHDGGIDGYGILELNPFVSMRVLFQCKRYKGSVSRAQVGDFRNAMIGRAEKGIILTTGNFTEEAKREASRDGAPPIELIDGEKLVTLFENINLGIKPRTVYDVDLQFFEPYMKMK
jgi:restriction system protein